MISSTHHSNWICHIKTFFIAKMHTANRFYTIAIGCYWETLHFIFNMATRMTDWFIALSYTMVQLNEWNSDADVDLIKYAKRQYRAKQRKISQFNSSSIKGKCFRFLNCRSINLSLFFDAHICQEDCKWDFRI